MNLAEMLLATDAGKITKKATKDYEVKRLTKITGEPFVLHLKERLCHNKWLILTRNSV